MINLMKTTVGVFMGGISVEHEISVISAIQAIHAIDKQKYDVVPVYISKKGVMYTSDLFTNTDNFSDMNKLLVDSTEVSLSRSDDGVYLLGKKTGIFKKAVEIKIDVAFPVVHGTNCEDGSIQGLFESLALPYVGCDVLSSALGMDKVVMKQVLQHNSIPVVDYTFFYGRDFIDNEEQIIEKVEEIGYPVIVKPANLGSSVGIKKADDRQQLVVAIKFASEFASKILVEKAVADLREINCSVLGDYSQAQASVCEEPFQSDEILSYTDKYCSNGSKGSKGMSSLKRKCPAELTDEKRDEIQKMSVKTFKALGANGVSRIDFLLDKADNNKVYVNEINTIPGSLSFYLWEASGVSFQELTTKLIELAFKRSREKSNLSFSFDQNIFALQGTKGLTGKK